jgi:hypothetical protein
MALGNMHTCYRVQRLTDYNETPNMYCMTYIWCFVGVEVFYRGWDLESSSGRGYEVQGCR